MFNRFDVWKYSETSNCWDYVREYLIEKGFPPEDFPKSGIAPSDKRGMTKQAEIIQLKFVECGPINNAIACHYHGRVLRHVGVVDGLYVRHTNDWCGTMKVRIKQFERMAQKTIYRIHESLWQS